MIINRILFTRLNFTRHMNIGSPIILDDVNNKTSTRGLIKWKGCHVHSNIFIRLVSGYSCVSYLIASVLIINLLCYSDLNLDININLVQESELGFISSLLSFFIKSK